MSQNSETGKPRQPSMEQKEPRLARALKFKQNSMTRSVVVPFEASEEVKVDKPDGIDLNSRVSFELVELDLKDDHNDEGEQNEVVRTQNFLDLVDENK